MTTSGGSRRSELLPRGGVLYSRCRAAPKRELLPFGGSAAASAASVGVLYSRCRAAPKGELLPLRGQRSGVSRKRGGTLFALQGHPKVRIAPPSGAAQRRQPQAWGYFIDLD